MWDYSIDMYAFMIVFNNKKENESEYVVCFIFLKIIVMVSTMLLGIINIKKSKINRILYQLKLLVRQKHFYHGFETNCILYSVA